MGLARTSHALERQLGRASRFLAGFVWVTASDDVLTATTVAINGRVTAPPPDAGLFEWEREWLDEALPPAPARVLVSGAGRGREVVALQRRGYEVDALEPSSAHGELTRVCRGRSWRLAHQDLAAGRGPDGPYDAVLLGWGSFSYVLEPEAREALVARLDALCPAGPLLASFARRVESRSAALAHGAEVGGKLLRARRGLDPGVSFLPHAGFLIGLDEAEIGELGRRVGREAGIAGGPMARVTWSR